MPRWRASVEERFWEKVERGPNCWTWIGGLANKGYGTFFYQGRLIGAHRASYQIAYGPIEDGAWVLHRCDNPPCVRPDHLFLGDARTNVADMDKKGRANRPAGDRHLNAQKTHCPRGHPYDEQNTRRDRAGGRYCRTCNRERMRVKR